MTKGCSGAGDQVGMLNAAYAWAEFHKTDVELEVHWESPKDFFYHPDDPEKMCERLLKMQTYMHPSKYSVSVVNLWDSDIFNYIEGREDNFEIRLNTNPLRWILPSKEAQQHPHASGEERGNVPFDYQFGLAEWKWKDAPEQKAKKIVWWDYSKNRENPQEMKTVKSFDDLSFPTFMNLCFPDYELVELSYRESFEHAYNHIRDCSFCIGYDGMWHMVARNFGKLFVCSTGNPMHTQRHTNPGSAAFFNEPHFYGYLYKIAEDTKFLKREIQYAKTYHKKRMEWYGKVEG